MAKRITRKSDIKDNQRYTLWLFMPYDKFYTIERSYRGRYIKDDLWAQITSYNKTNRRKMHVFLEGVNPNQKNNPTKHRKNYFLFFGVQVPIWNTRTKKACFEDFAGDDKIWHLTNKNNVTQIQASNFPCGEIGFKSKKAAIDYKTEYRTPKSQGGWDVERNPKRNFSLEYRVNECPKLRKTLRAKINAMKRREKQMVKAISTGNHRLRGVWHPAFKDMEPAEVKALVKADLAELRRELQWAEKAINTKANPRHKKNMYGPFILEDDGKVVLPRGWGKGPSKTPQGRGWTFKDVKVGQSFFYDGQTFKKKSSRTAYVHGRPKNIVYFKGADVIDSDTKSSRRKASGVARRQIPNPTGKKMVQFWSTTKGLHKEKVYPTEDIYTLDFKWLGRVGHSDLHMFPAYMKAKHAKPDQVYFKTRYQAKKAAEEANEWNAEHDVSPGDRLARASITSSTSPLGVTRPEYNLSRNPRRRRNH